MGDYPVLLGPECRHINNSDQVARGTGRCVLTCPSFTCVFTCLRAFAAP